MCSLGSHGTVFQTFVMLLVASALIPHRVAADAPKPGEVILEIKGYLVPARRVAISPSISGQIVELPIEVGTRVRAGDILARLDPSESQAGLRLALAELRLAEAEATRAKDGNKSDLAIAQAKVEVAQARVSLAQLRLDRTTVRAPIAGTVLVKHAQVGGFINLATNYNVICELADLRALEVDVEVSERDIAKIDIGQPCLIRPDAFPDKTYRGRVDRILPEANSSKAIVGIRVRMEIPEKDESLRPQMAAIVTIMARAKVARASGDNPLALTPTGR